jgi:GntR family transcriptional regulator
MTEGWSNQSRAEPLYHQIEKSLLERIVSGQWPHGSQISTEEELCAAYGVSRITVRHALKNLAAKGYLVRNRGRGTFIQAPTLTAGVRGLQSFSQEMSFLGLEVGARVLSLERQPAPIAVAERLGLPLGEEIVVIRRLRTGDNTPIGIQTAHLVAKRFPDLQRATFKDRSLYAHLESHYGMRPLEAQETFWATPISGEEASLLEVNDGACGFRVERVTSDAIGIFEYTVSIMRGDRYRIQWTLRNP